MKSLKKIWSLCSVFLWYYVCRGYVTPVLMKYLFDERGLVSELFAEIFTLGIPVMYYVLHEKLGREKTFDIHYETDRKISYSDIALIIVTSIALSFGIWYLVNGFKLVHIFVTSDYSVVEIMPVPTLAAFLLTVLSYSILPAVYEEFLYRGMCYDVMRNLPRFLVCVLSALLFVVAHSSVYSRIAAFVLGLVLMNVYIEFNSIVIVVVIHLINNIISLIVDNYFEMPYSALAVLKDYANDIQIRYAVFISFGLSLIMLIIASWCGSLCKLQKK